jgi:hypothetical protein
MRHDQTTRPMSKSPVAIARLAMQVGQAALPCYSSKYSPQTNTQPQLFACLMLRQFFKTDYRGWLNTTVTKRLQAQTYDRTRFRDTCRFQNISNSFAPNWAANSY